MYMQNVHAKYKTWSKRKEAGCTSSHGTEQDQDGAGTYLRYILPAHPDHNCEKDALVRRQKGPEGSYPGLSGRWGDQIDWAQILLAI